MAFEYLARVAVFIEQARIGENLALNENVSFEDEFRQLEDNHEAGLYWLLCALHRVIFVTGTIVSQEVIDGVMSIQVLEVDRNALRHTRDYLVLRDFEHLCRTSTNTWNTHDHLEHPGPSGLVWNTQD